MSKKLTFKDVEQMPGYGVTDDEGGWAIFHHGVWLYVRETNSMSTSLLSGFAGFEDNPENTITISYRIKKIPTRVIKYLNRVFDSFLKLPTLNYLINFRPQYIEVGCQRISKEDALTLFHRLGEYLDYDVEK